MATINPSEALQAGATAGKKITTLFIVMAVLFIILGILAIAEPMVAGLAIALLVGWLLIFAGGAHFVGAFSGGTAGQRIWQILLGILYIGGGLYFIMNPVIGLSTLTLVLASIILVEAVIELVSYFRNRQATASGWLLLNAIVTLLLGGLIWFHWPSSSVWAIGTLVGVNLLMTGISRLMFALAARKLLAA
jgi:uncharacterized membrane protein HdeD (DUF308 family)